MKKFEVFFSSLFVIGLIGVLSLVFFVDKPVENYFAASLISVIAMLPRVLFVFFMSPRDLIKTTFSGALKFYLSYIAFIVLENWIFPYNVKTSFVGPLIAPAVTVIVFICGWRYYRKNKEAEVLNEVIDIAEDGSEIKKTEEQLKFQEMFVLPAHDKVFDVGENFKLTQLKYEGIPHISYLGPNFVKHFNQKIEPARGKRSLNRYRTFRDLVFSIFSSIITKGNHYTTISDIWDTLVLWEKGYRVLLENGKFNIFPVYGFDSKIWYIIVTKNKLGDSWEIEAYPQIGDVHKKENVYSLN